MLKPVRKLERDESRVAISIPAPSDDTLSAIPTRETCGIEFFAGCNSWATHSAGSRIELNNKTVLNIEFLHTKVLSFSTSSLIWRRRNHLLARVAQCHSWYLRSSYLWRMTFTVKPQSPRTGGTNLRRPPCSTKLP